jgi:lipopolysaccharide biosynthesis glycosyltransferase
MNGVSEPKRRQGIFFVTDRDFALPTIASALEIRKKVPLDRADVRIVTTDVPIDTVHRLRDFLDPQGIQTDVLDPLRFSAFDHRSYNQTHVPISALGRFFMLEAVPDVYDRILYLDGDTWPCGDPLRLLEAELPDGCVGAAEDRNYFRRHELGPVGRKTRAYFSGLGIDSDKGYFNSGVLLAGTQTWRSLSADAFDFFSKNTARCLYHDQSALNAVAGTRRIRLAPQWNFTSSYLDWRVKSEIPPKILHFAGGEKPWTVPFHPYYMTYMAAFALLSKLELTTKQYSPEELEAIKRRARLRRVRDKLFVYRKIIYQKMFDRLVRSSVIS